MRIPSFNYRFRWFVMATCIGVLGCSGTVPSRWSSKQTVMSAPIQDSNSRTQLVNHPTSARSTPIVSAQALFMPEKASSSSSILAVEEPLNPVRIPTDLNATILEPESSLLLKTEHVSTHGSIDIHDAAEVDRIAQQLHWMGDYQIETGDSLEVKFRLMKELNDVVTVRPDGMISLQLVGDQLAEGLAPEQLRKQLELAYSKDLVNPDLVVIVRSFSGNSIYIGGEVFNPVRIPLTGRVTTLKAVILAGGFKDTADKKRVIVRRDDGTCCQYDLKSVLDCNGGQDIELRPYDVVYVPKSKIAKINLFVEQYIVKVLPFSNSFGVFVSHNTGLGGGMVP